MGVVSSDAKCRSNVRTLGCVYVLLVCTYMYVHVRAPIEINGICFKQGDWLFLNMNFSDLTTDLINRRYVGKDKETGESD